MERHHGRRSRRLPSLAVAWLLVLGGAAAGLGQEPAREEAEPAAAPSVPVASEAAAAGAGTDDDVAAPTAGDFEPFLDTVNVRVVNVDVFVTDKKGEPVTGLAAEDFELVEDGRPVEITNFYAVESGRRRDGAEAPPATAGSLAPTTANGGPGLLDEAPIPEAQRLHLVVYVDNFNIRPFNRNRVLGEIGYFLTSRLDSDDRVMLVSYERSLRVRQPFTSDPRLIASGLDELERVTGHAVSRDDERRHTLEQIEQAGSIQEAAAHARMHSESMQNDLRFTVDALKELIGTLAGLPGRKAILYVSDGLPMVPGQDVYHAVDARFNSQGAGILSESFSYDSSRDFRDLAHLANANRVSFYTLDAAGLRVQTAYATRSSRPNLSAMVDLTYNSNHQSPLRFLADTTGGQAIINSNRALPGLEKVARDFGTYYSLGFSPTHAANGRYHRLEVRVKGRRGLVVRHREGYRDKTIDARMTDGTIAALHFTHDQNPLAAALRFPQIVPHENRLYRVAVDVDVPIDRLVLIPRGDSHHARLRLFVAALDAQGDSSPVQQVVVPIEVPDDELELARGQLYRYRLPIVTRSGPHRVAVGIRDELGGEESFVTGQVNPGGG